MQFISSSCHAKKIQATYSKFYPFNLSCLTCGFVGLRIPLICFWVTLLSMSQMDPLLFECRKTGSSSRSVYECFFLLSTAAKNLNVSLTLWILFFCSCPSLCWWHFPCALSVFSWLVSSSLLINLHSYHLCGFKPALLKFYSVNNSTINLKLQEIQICEFVILMGLNCVGGFAISSYKCYQ